MVNTTQEPGLDWHDHFRTQSDVDLDFVIGQTLGWPVGMERRSPREFRRRVVAVAQSYVMQLSSIDYALKRYVDSDQYSNEPILAGDTVSDFIKISNNSLREHLKDLNTPDPDFGRFGAELTLFKTPDVLEVARMLGNRGLFLEAIPTLRLAIEMTAWAIVAFHSADEDFVTQLQAQSCLASLRAAQPSAGRIYGYVSKFSHWEKVIHPFFLRIDEDKIGIIRASTKYRAMSLALCLVVLNLLVEAVRYLYVARADALVTSIQRTKGRGKNREIYKQMVSISKTTELDEIKMLKKFLN